MPDVSRASQLPLIGRERELTGLLALLAKAGTGEPGAALVAGDAGVGKTRLLDELRVRAAAAGAVVLVGHCLDVGPVGLPYLPFTEALSSLAAGGDPALPVGPVSWDGSSTAGRGVGRLQLFDAVASVLADAASRSPGPVLLIVEDLHWADQSSRDLLAFLLGRLAGQRLLVVASYRADDLHRRHPLRPVLAQLARLPTVSRLQLAPFDTEEMQAFLMGLSDGPLEDAVVEQILDRSEGNAFFAQELLSSFLAGRPSGLPDDLAELLLTRLERLSEDAQRVVRIAAVARRRVSDRLLTLVSGLSEQEVQGGVREAVAHQVLVADSDGYSFRHALLAEAVYGDLLPGERVRLHAEYARCMADGGGGPDALGAMAELAHHRLASHDLPAALTASIQAADEAEQLHAPAESLKHLEQALQLWDAAADATARAGVDLAGLNLRAASVAHRAGELVRAAGLAAAALALVDPVVAPGRAARVRQELAYHLYNADRFDQALEMAEAALELAAGGSEPTRTSAWAAATAARALLTTDRHHESRAMAEHAVAAAVATGTPDAQADALVTLAALDNAQGDRFSSATLLSRAQDQARLGDDLATELRVAYALAADRYDAGELDLAAELVDAAVDRCLQHGLSWSPYGLELRTLQVTVRYVTGNWPGSAEAAQVPAPRPPAPAVARLAAASLYVAVGRGDPAATGLFRHLDGAWQSDAALALVAGSCGSDLLRWQEQPLAAVHCAQRALEVVAQVWDEPWFLGGIRLAALALAAVGDLAETARLTRDRAGEADAVATGARLLERARSTAQQGQPRGGALGPEGQAWLVRAEAEHSRVVGEPDAVAWQRAVQGFAYGHVYEQARSRWRHGEALLALERRDDAVVELQAAWDVAARLGARPLEAAVLALAQRGRLGLDGAPAPVADTRLTARERQVLTMLAEGLTNRQIGERLFIAEKTASVHVSNILGKLGAHGRTEAVSLAHRTGLLPS